MEAVKTFWSQFAANVMAHRTHEQGADLHACVSSMLQCGRAQSAGKTVTAELRSRMRLSATQAYAGMLTVLSSLPADYFFPWLATRMPQLAKLERRGSGEDHCWQHCEDPRHLADCLFPCSEAHAVLQRKCCSRRDHHVLPQAPVSGSEPRPGRTGCSCRSPTCRGAPYFDSLL